MTALDYALDGDAEYRQIERELADAEEKHDGVRIAALHERLHTIGGYAAPARAAELLHGLGFGPGEENRKVAEFSGGWRMRMNLAQALMCRSDLLLLDEPTNHLDLDAVIWLEGWLKRYPGTLLIISHDREFLDAVVTHVISIADQTAELFSGNLSGYERKRSERLSQQQSMFEKQQRERAHLQRFVDRFRAQATKARQAQSRIKALERMVDIAPIRAASTIQFEFREPSALPVPLLKLDEIAAGYGQRRVLSDIKMILSPGDRIALLGANGAGKSTFIKMLAGASPPLAGERLAAKDLKIGYFAQHQLEQLDMRATPVEHLKELDASLGEKAARDFLGGFGFSGTRALDVVEPFSGGEKARLCLALTIYQRPNLLLLDEPTNHLDLDTREALTEALNDYTGALILVAHDRALIRACCDTLLHVGGGRVSAYDGDLDDYARLVLRGDPTPAAAAQAPATAGNRRDERRARADERARLLPLRQQIQRIEKRIAEIDVRKRDIEAALAAPHVYEAEQSAQLAELTRLAALLNVESGKLEDAWLHAHHELEQATTG
jgi:ATP-binding cassette subfamily F protein 3